MEKDQEEILSSIQNHYIPFMKKLIAHVEKKDGKDKKPSKVIERVKYVFTIFTESDKKEKIEAYHACKDMLDKWHEKYKAVKGTGDNKRPDDEPNTSSAAESRGSGNQNDSTITQISNGSTNENWKNLTNIKKEKTDSSNQPNRIAYVHPQQKSSDTSISAAGTSAASNSASSQVSSNTPSLTVAPMRNGVEFVCASCQFKTKDENDFMKHARTDHRTDLSLWCKQCGKCFSNAGVLVSHIKESNCEKEEMIYRCGVKECTFETSSGQTFVHHLRHCHKGSPFIFCIHCQKIFTLPHCLILHMQNECPFKEKNRKNPSAVSATPANAPQASSSPTSSQLSSSSASQNSGQKSQKKTVEEVAKPKTNSFKPVPPPPASSPAAPITKGSPAPGSLKRANNSSRGGRGGRKRTRALYSDSSDSDDPDDPSWKPEESTNSQPRRRSARWAKKVSESQNPDLFESENSSKKAKRSEQPKKNSICCPCCDFTAVFESLMSDHYITDHKHPSRNSCLVCSVKFESKKLFLDHFSNHQKDKENEKNSSSPSVMDVADVDSSDSRDSKTEENIKEPTVPENAKGSPTQDQKMDVSVEAVSDDKSQQKTVDVRDMDFSVSGVKIPYQTTLNDKFQGRKIKGFEDLKSSEDLQKMKTETKLKHFYKCVLRGCSFTTDDSVFYVSHLTERHKDEKFHCVYCLCEMASAKELANHMLEKHGRRCYQCSLCFYRGSSKAHVQLHMKHVHPGNKFIVYTCSTHLTADYKFNTESESSNLTTTWPYMCAMGDCKYQAYDMKDFEKHNESSHKGVSVFLCYYCKVDFISFKRLLSHYHLHGINLFQCTYCVHGTETKDEILLHQVNCHPDKPLKVHIRAAPDPDVPKAANEPSVEAPKQNSICTTTEKRSALRVMMSNTRINDELPKLIKHFEKDVFCRLPFCLKKFVDLVSYVNHLIKSHHASNIPCPYCSLVLDDIELFTNHVACHGSNLYSCINEVCGFYSWSRNDVIEHMKEAHKLKNAMATCVRSSPIPTKAPDKSAFDQLKFDSGNYVCLFCYFKVSDEKVMKNHMYLELNYKRFLCNLCKSKCHSRKEAFNHFLENHSHHNIKCTIDNNSELEYLVKSYLVPSVQKVMKLYVKNEEKLVNPLLQQLPCFSSKYSCETCNLSFQTLREAQYHLHRCLHGGYLAFMCSRCDSKTTDLVDMKIHTSDCHQESLVSYETFRNQLLEEQVGRNICLKRIKFLREVMEFLLLDANQLTNIRNKTTIIEPKLYKCGHCKFNDGFRTNVEKHCQGCHKDKKEKVNKESPDLKLPKATRTIMLAEGIDCATETTMPEDKTTKRYMCGFCNKKTYTFSELENHIESNHSGREETAYSFFYWPNPDYDFPANDTALFECAYCNMSKENLHNLKRHCNNLHSEVPFKVRGTKSSNSLMSHCKYCNFQALSLELVKIHNQQCHKESSKRKGTGDDTAPAEKKSAKGSGKFKCQHCNERFGSHLKMLAHVRKEHPYKSNTRKSAEDGNTVLLNCNVCSFIGEESLLYEHVSKKHKEYVGCAYCKNYFATVPELEQHNKKSHRGQDLVMIKAENASSQSQHRSGDGDSSKGDAYDPSKSFYNVTPEPIDMDHINVTVEGEEELSLPIKYVYKMYNLLPDLKIDDVMTKKKS